MADLAKHERAANALTLTSKLIQHRDAFRARYVSGAMYEAEMKEIRAIILGVAKESGLPLAQAVLRIVKDMDAKNVDPSIVFAAFVEECEALHDRTKQRTPAYD